MALSWVEVDLDAVAYNVRQLRTLVGPKAELMAVVKSNAYGHGLLPVAQTALSAGASWLGVIAGSEALMIRVAGLVAPILILGPVEDAELDTLLDTPDVRFAVFDLTFARKLSNQARGRRIRVHVEVDTGLGRLSVAEDEAVEFTRTIAALPGLGVEGLYTHLADAEGMDQGYTMRQFAAFGRITAALREAGIEVPLRHLAGSAAGILLSDLRCDLVRAGISVYGFWPAEETRLLLLSHQQDLLTLANDSEVQARGVRNLFALLRPALTWKAHLVQVKTVPAESAVGYGCTFRTLRPTRVGVVSVGYADGFDRHLSNRGHVLVRGRRAPVIGRVCMNLIMVDVTDISAAEAGDEVVLIGRQGTEAITAQEMAAHVGTIHYEVVTRINWALPRVYLNPPTGVDPDRLIHPMMN